MKIIKVKTQTKKDGAKKIEGFSIKSDGYMWTPSGSGNLWKTKAGSYSFELVAYGGDYIHDGLKLDWHSVPTSVNDFLYDNYAEISVRSYATPEYTMDFLNKILPAVSKKDATVANEIKKMISTMKPVQKSADKLYDFLNNKSYIEI